MEIIFNHLYKIDKEANTVMALPPLDGTTDLRSYVLELVTNVLDSSDRKGFVFQSQTTEVQTLINRILTTSESNSEDFNSLTLAIAKRLLIKEVAAQKQVDKFGVKVLKGVIVVSLVKFDEKCKVIISKADYNDFIDAVTFLTRSGFPLKKKIYKAFIADVNENNDITRTSVFDTNTPFSTYWWRDFLELREVNSSEYNTQKAFDVLESKILNPIKRKSKADYFNLWNTTVHYFRVKNEFSLDDYVNSVIRDYDPFDGDIDIKDLETKARSLPSKFNFDNRFEITKGLLNKRFKKSIELTPQIDLLLKQDIEDIQNTIQPRLADDGTKWIMIKSDFGYDHFDKQLKNEGK